MHEQTPEGQTQYLNDETLATPSRERWAGLCRELDRLEGHALTVALCWLEVRLERWPSSCRPAPLRWALDALAGRPQPRLVLARTLVLSPSMLSRGDWASRLARCESLRGLERLWIDGVGVDAWDLGTLAEASWTRGLSALCLTRCDLGRAEVRALGALLSGAPLAHLSLAGNHLDDMGLSLGLSRASGRRLMYLDLRGNPLSEGLLGALEAALPDLHALLF